ncbi:MAG: virion core protein [Tissierellia bacterium]|jgi:membrane protease subunit (stomatin/prohibitin family)|nr:SPFH domain-containing protein [Bacillota bacterium]NLL22435.1 virion core protein [Tissierellia bacterium]
MGLIKAFTGAVGGGLADQWVEAIEPDNMSEGIVFTKGVFVRRDDRRNANVKGSADIISNGSLIHVYENQFMMLVDGGAIVDISAEPGMFKVDNSSAPSVFNGELGESIKETFNRFRFGGATPLRQQAFYVNLAEIKGIKFGTRNPINYFDTFYNAELFLRAHGTYSIRITDPILFYKNVISKNATRVHIDEINEQYQSEFLEGLQVAINRLSMEGERISFVVSQSSKISAYLADALDDLWREKRGFEVEFVGIASISYDEASTELINMRNRGAMLQDASVRQGYVQGSIARGLEALGSNEAGGAAIMGMGVGMNVAGGFMDSTSQANMAQMAQQQQVAQQTQAAAGMATVAGGWTCSNSHAGNTGNFCATCGEKRPEASTGAAFCTNCGHKFEGAKPNFCPECGNAQ